MKNLLDTLAQTNADAMRRRHFLQQCVMGFGTMALGSLMGCERGAATEGAVDPLAMLTHFAPKAKRVIFLHMVGAPSQLELFENKPTLQKLDGLDCPPSLLAGKRFAFIVGTPKMLGPYATFDQYGQTGATVSNHLPYFQSVVDEITFLRAMHTDEFNHAPAQLVSTYRQSPAGSPEFRIVGNVRAGQRERKPAGFHGTSLRRCHSKRGQKHLGQRVSAVAVSGRTVPNPG